MARVNTVKSFRGTTKTPDGNLTCSKCSAIIKPGDGYRWWANRMPGSASGIRRIRCMRQECRPTIADTTPGRRGELYQLQADVEQEAADADTVEELEQVASSAGDRLHEMAQEMTEGADNMEEGFGHETSQSQELRERGEALDEVADMVEQLTFEAPDTEDEYDADQWDEYSDYLDQHMSAQRELITEQVAEAEV